MGIEGIKMNKFKIEITETLQKTIELEAESLEEALYKAECLYKEEKIILDSSDFVDVNISKKNE